METPKNEPWNFCKTPKEKCTTNYCDDNGCQNRKRSLVEPKKSKASTFILGQIDKSIEKSTLEQQIEKLEAEKAELIENHFKLFRRLNSLVNRYQLGGFEDILEKSREINRKHSEGGLNMVQSNP